ncbi:MAG: histidine phosphatase family protein [Sarcina sp.]
MRTKLYLTRHGETIWNTEGRFQGWANSDLTDLGVKQAKWLERRIRDLQIDIIYSSPTGRAYQTAEILRANRNLKIITDDGLREINVGVWEGKNQEEIKSLCMDNHYNFWNVPSMYVPTKGGESYKEMLDRSFNAISEIVKKNEGKRILVVTHTITIKSFMCMLEKREIDTLWHEPFVKQTSLTEIDFNSDEYEILLNADMSHHEYSFREFNEFK